MQSNLSCQKVDQWLVEDGGWGQEEAGGNDEAAQKTSRVTDTLNVVIFSQVYTYIKTYQTVPFNMYSLLNVSGNKHFKVWGFFLRKSF